MLKIKDNVDLKELEKYGFKKDEMNGYVLKRYTGLDSCIFLDVTDDKYRYFSICMKEEDTIPDDIQDLIYDLIKDSLIEKV